MIPDNTDEHRGTGGLRSVTNLAASTTRTQDDADEAREGGDGGEHLHDPRAALDLPVVGLLLNVVRPDVFDSLLFAGWGWYRKFVPSSNVWRMTCTPPKRRQERSSSMSNTASRQPPWAFKLGTVDMPKCSDVRRLVLLPQTCRQ